MLSVLCFVADCELDSLASLLLIFIAITILRLFQRDAPPVGYRNNFSCVGRAAGYYADISSGCQVSLCSLPAVRWASANLWLSGKLLQPSRCQVSFCNLLIVRWASSAFWFSGELLYTSGCQVSFCSLLAVRWAAGFSLSGELL